MPTFEWPWAFALLPLPYLVHRLVPPFQARERALRVPFLPRLRTLLGDAAVKRARTRSRLNLACLLLAWVLVVTAIARPVQHGAPIVRQTAARDLLLAVDLSGSMAQTDLTPEGSPPTTRLDVVKRVVGAFIRDRKGDRLGLIVFGTSSFVQVPFTLDTDVVAQLLNETDVGMAGPQTALGDAIGLSLDVFTRSDAKSRVVIALTDGNDTGSSVPPLQAARIAAARGVTLYTIGVGDPRSAGEEALNTEALTTIAALTHGRYLQADDEHGLREAYRRLDALEPVAHRTIAYQPRRAVSHYPLAGVTLLLGLSALLRGARGLFSMRGARPRRGSAPPPRAATPPLGGTVEGSPSHG